VAGVRGQGKALLSGRSPAGAAAVSEGHSRIPGCPFGMSVVVSSPQAPILLASSLVIGAASSVVLGRQEWGLGKTWNRAVVFQGRGSGFSPSAFPDWSPLLPVYSRSRAAVFPTSPSCSIGGVRPGTWRRRGASASAQAEGEPRRKRGARRPRVRALCCAVRGVYGCCIGGVSGQELRTRSDGLVVRRLAGLAGR
jgi:hypothetical protein